MTEDEKMSLEAAKEAANNIELPTIKKTTIRSVIEKPLRAIVLKNVGTQDPEWVSAWVRSLVRDLIYNKLWDMKTDIVRQLYVFEHYRPTNKYTSTLGVDVLIQFQKDFDYDSLSEWTKGSGATHLFEVELHRKYYTDYHKRD
ncbi:MAG: hypothetical protein ACTSUE_26395 [Promethearchaeota archaeon]